MTRLQPATALNAPGLQHIDQAFVGAFAKWIVERKELLAVASFGAGDRDYWLCTSLDDLARFCDLMASGYEAASVAVFSGSQLELRGVVDEAFIDQVRNTFVEPGELLVLRLTPQKSGLLSGNACQGQAELLAELRDEFGSPVAVGPFPTWEPLSAQVSAEAEYLHTTVHRRT
jgi:hypothetical protein